MDKQKHAHLQWPPLIVSFEKIFLPEGTTRKWKHVLYALLELFYLFGIAITAQL